MSFILSLFSNRRKYAVGFFLFLLLTLGVVAQAQESSLSPTPSVSPSSSTPLIPDINPETLPDPSAFKLDQEIKQATRDFFNSLQRNESLTILENKASRRKSLMHQAIKEYAYVFLGNTVPLSYTALLDEKLQSYFEKPLTLSNAELGVTHIDDFEKHENSRFDYSLQNLQEHKTFNFYPAGDFGGHISGTTLNVNGVALDEDITTRVMNAPGGGGENNNDPVPTNIEILKEASPDATGPQRVAVILIKTKGATFTPYYTKEQIEEIIFRGDVQKFFKEASYGKMWFDEEKSRVYGWYEVENLDIDGWNNIPNTSSDEFIRIIDNDVDFTQFDRIMIGGSVETNTYGGWGDVGKYIRRTNDGDIRITLNTFGVGSNLANIAVHESGHNFGLGHANSWSCSEGSLKGNCEHREYGNIFDSMGTGYLRHFNGYFKEVLQWLNKPVINITQSGKYNLQPIEYADAVVAKISRPGASKFPIFYLETRIPVGFDDDTNLVVKDVIHGVHINWINNPLETRFLTISPRIKTAGFGSSGEPLDAWLGKIEPLYPGQSFRDEKLGLIITNIDDTTVDIQLEQLKEPECKDNDLDVKLKEINALEPFERDKKTIEWVKSPASLACTLSECTLKRNKQNDWLITFWLDIKNNNHYLCPDVMVETWSYKSWGKQTKDVVSSTIPSAETVNRFAMFDIPAFTPSGRYDADIRVENAETDQVIFSTTREIQIVDEFQTLEGDLTADGKVDIFDLVTVAKNFGKQGEGLEGDADRDGKVDFFDLVLVAKNFGKKAE